jgi:DNA-binding NtrC family response regulator
VPGTLLIAGAREASELARHLRDAGWVVSSTEDDALAAVREQAPDVLLLGPEAVGAAALAQDLERRASVPGLVVDPAHPAAATLCRGVDARALPESDDPALAVAVCESALRGRVHRVERRRLRRDAERERGGPLVVRSPAMARLVAQVERAARTPGTTVLVHAPAGSGAELTARTLHARSARADGPFVVLRVSAVARAEGGTLFVDEVADLAAPQQAVLSVVLETRARPARDGTAEVAADLRVVAGTSRDLEDAAAAGNLREDLLYRLNVLALRVPPLDERADDLPELATRALARAGRLLGRAACEPSEELLDSLNSRAWPGDVRELEEVLLAAAARAGASDLTPAHLDAAPGDLVPAALPTAPQPAGVRSLAEQEEDAIRRALAETGGNRSAAARRLGIHRATLHAKLRRMQA